MAGVTYKAKFVVLLRKDLKDSLIRQSMQKVKDEGPPQKKPGKSRK